ncbi:MAG: hypothetical protein LKG24_01740 [Lacticaseibacillus songhuajiangensis]|jgi:HK97 gp10 family phage protein|nr:hypothetical protein [Lacticaseibacillus songhuajiangensis]
MADDPFASMNKFLAGKAKKVQNSKSAVQSAADIFVNALKKNVPYGSSRAEAKYGHVRDNLGVQTTSDGVDATWGDAFWYYFLDHGTAPSKKGGTGQPAQNLTQKTWAQVESKVWAAMEKTIE